MRDLADDFGFPLKETNKIGQIHQVETWFKKNRPNHEKQGRQLVFDVRLRLQEVKILTELHRTELDIIVKNFKITPLPKYKYVTKAKLIDHINKDFALRRPNHKRDHNNVLIFEPKR